VKKSSNELLQYVLENGIMNLLSDSITMGKAS